MLAARAALWPLRLGQGSGREEMELAQPMPKRIKRDRSREYEMTTLKRTLAANPNTKEAQVWSNLQDKRPYMQNLQNEFLKDFKESGFNMVEGTRWCRYTQSERFVQDGEYMTEEQILHEERGSQEIAKARMQWARDLGEGTPEPGKGRGYFRDPMRGGAWVYKYFHNVKHRQQVESCKGRETMQRTGQLDTNTLLQGRGSLPQLQDAQQESMSISSTDLASQPLTPPRDSGLACSSDEQVSSGGGPVSDVAPPANSISEAMDTHPVQGGSSPPPTESGAAAVAAPKPEETTTVADYVRKATEMMDQAKSHELLTGFALALTQRLAAVKKIEKPHLNYRCVKQLMSLVALSEQVLPVIITAEQA